MEESYDGEVHADALAGFRLASRHYTGDANTVFGSELEYFCQARKRFAWERVAGLYARLEALLPPGETLEDCGRFAFEAPRLGGLLKSLSILTSPSRFILMGNRFGIESLFTHLRVKQQLRRSETIELHITIPR